MAGLIAGVAMQTKYTAFLALATMVLYAGVEAFLGRGTMNRKIELLGLGFVAVATASCVFVLWEWFIATR